MKTKVSVIVPIYNVEKYLRRCIDSLVAQTIDSLQIILVDDGSPDNCGAICDEYSERFQGGGHLLHVIHKENGGVSSARNAGLDVAEGEYIAFVDADDSITPECYERLYEKVATSGADFVLHGVIREKKNGLIKMLPYGTKKEICYEKQDFLHWFARAIAKPGRGLLLFPFNKLYKYSLLNGIKFDTNYTFSEDFIFNLALYEKAQKVVLMSYSPYTYFSNEGSASHSCSESKVSRWISDDLKVIEEVYSFFKRNNLDNYRTCLERYAASMYYGKIHLVLKNFDVHNSSAIAMLDMLVKGFRRKYMFYMYSPKAFFVMFLLIHKKYALLFKLYNLKQKIFPHNH